MLDAYFLEIEETDFTVNDIGAVEILQGTSISGAEAIQAVEIIESAGVGGGGAPTTGSITESMLAPSFLRHIEALLVWNGTGTQPLRSTVTSDNLRPVRWRQPVAPPFTSGYAISGLDVWEQTP